MATVKKSIRISEELAAQVEASRLGGESWTSALSRLTRIGLGGAEGVEYGEDTQTLSYAEYKAMTEERIADLRKEVDVLSEQLRIKDAQISAKDEQLLSMTSAVTQAQSLHAVDSVKALAEPTDRPGFLRRLFGRG